MLLVVDDPDLRAVVRAALGKGDLRICFVKAVCGMARDLGQTVVAQWWDAEGLSHRDAALARETRGREHAHRGQHEVALELRLDQVGRMRRHR